MIGVRRKHNNVRLIHIVLILPVLFNLGSCNSSAPSQFVPDETQLQITPLPAPRPKGELSLEEALLQRRSTREFEDQPLDISEISQILWAGQGITNTRGFRTAPSAGALYPLELYIVTEDGVFHYLPHDHALQTILEGDLREPLYKAGLSQEAIVNAPMVLVVTAVYERTQMKYGAERSPRYVHMEAGHAAQNVLLQAVSLGLGAVPIGAFFDEDVQEVLNLPEDHRPLYLIPIGHPE